MNNNINKNLLEEKQQFIKELGEPKIAGKYQYFLTVIKNLNLEMSVKAARLVIDEMNASKGFERHDGSDYFVHPIEVAQEALNFGLYDDEIIASCLLHDVIEDVEFVTYEYIQKEFSEEVAIIVDNVSKRDGEEHLDYIKRVSSHPKSAVVKTLDRVNNISTMGHSSLKHRQKQLIETRGTYLPLIKSFRKEYWEYSEVFHYARMLIDRFLIEIERSVNLEIALNAKKTLQK